MKKIMLLVMVFIGIGFTGCTTKVLVTSVEKYDECINEAKADLQKHGYELSGMATETKNEPLVVGAYYSSKTGSSSILANDFYDQEVYSFSNSNGDEVEFTMKYRGRYSKYTDTVCLLTVDLLGCKTSKAEDYDKFCGENSIIKQKLGNMEQDMKVSAYSPRRTSLLTTSILLATVLPFIFLL